MRRLREPVSGLTHLIGAMLGVAGTVVLMVAAVGTRDVLRLLGVGIFGLSLTLLYATSAIYHLVPKTEMGIRLWRRLDYTMIYVLIAGTYTPICLIALPNIWGWTMLGAVWTLSIGGSVLRLCWPGAPQALAIALYVIIGWLGIFAFFPLIAAVPFGAVLWLIVGGFFYTAGAIIFAIKRPNFHRAFGFHELWHLFVMAGSSSHFWVVLGYIVVVR